MEHAFVYRGGLLASPSDPRCSHFLFDGTTKPLGCKISSGTPGAPFVVLDTTVAGGVARLAAAIATNQQLEVKVLSSSTDSATGGLDDIDLSTLPSSFVLPAGTIDDSVPISTTWINPQVFGAAALLSGLADVPSVKRKLLLRLVAEDGALLFDGAPLPITDDLAMGSDVDLARFHLVDLDRIGTNGGRLLVLWQSRVPNGAAGTHKLVAGVVGCRRP
jgi:hypothetical protein